MEMRELVQRSRAFARGVARTLVPSRLGMVALVCGTRRRRANSRMPAADSSQVGI
jgi:hypothetical protein